MGLGLFCNLGCALAVCRQNAIPHHILDDTILHKENRSFKDPGFL